MWATAAPFSCFASSKLSLRASPTYRSECSSLKIRASFFDYPLASRIMVRNLPYSTSENCLHDKFSKFGRIAEVKLVKDEKTTRSRGFAFIQFRSQDEAMLALENMDNQNLDGRVIYIEIAKPGRHAFGGYPRASGRPKQQHLQVQEDVSDCWY
ncbi:hypothetical protein FEM48_Zijuj01G0161000 [Ziziphus jujuba var. spinosa]|uniref:RRM domain-containing protein n=1 Tax=Ziziphus jujuba var. spinosa TaxID=714518 RepID=A0A978W281_ZIZJJ|nr:hypothetical protein FEM48_Zijuj01G0161000 [Ziziphus jujuba var. spinosa]